MIFYPKTRMHSSRMRTGSSLTECWSLLPRGVGRGSWGLFPGGVSAPRGCLFWGGVCSGGCLLPGRGGGVCSGGSVYSQGEGGVCSWGGVCSGGVCSRGWGWCLVQGGISQHALRQTPLPPVDRQMPVKILPWPNFVAAVNNKKRSPFISFSVVIFSLFFCLSGIFFW